ncbi:MAG: peptidase domain-containing ABC transporter [Rhodospirillales bacterium]
MAETFNKAAAAGPRFAARAFTSGGGFDLALLSLFINLLALAAPLFLLQVYDRVIPNAAGSTLILLVAGVGTALILEALLRMGRSHISAWMGARFEHHAGCAAMERMLSANIVDFERQGAGVHLERIGALSKLKDLYSGQTVLTLCDLPFTVIFLGAIAYLAGWLALVPTVLIVLFALTVWISGRGLRRSLENLMLADDRRYSFVIEALGGVHTVKGLAMEAQMARRYERLQEACAEAGHGAALSGWNAQSAGAVFSQLSMFTIVGAGAVMVIDGALTIGGLAACTILAGRAMQPLQRAAGLWAQVQSFRLARQSLGAVLAAAPEAPHGLPRMAPVKGDLELRGVSFHYGEGRDGEPLPPVFDNVSLNIKAGEVIGVRGDNSSGKSTLLHLMNGALAPGGGQVLIDGCDIRGFEPASVRSQAAYLPQKGILFKGTILENLTMFRPEMAQQAMDMARLLGLDEAVASTPMGFDTVVGDGAGEAAPSGLRQRIAICRALVDKPRILLFDEANAAMDGSGDAALKNLLEQLKGRVTMVLVSARPSTLRLADRIFEIDGAALHEERPAVTKNAAPRPQAETPA